MYAYADWLFLVVLILHHTSHYLNRKFFVIVVFMLLFVTKLCKDMFLRFLQLAYRQLIKQR